MLCRSMRKISLPAILTLAVLVLFGAFYAFNPPFRDWLAEAYAVFTTGNYDTIHGFLENYRQYGYLILLGAFLFQMFLFVVPSVMVMTLCVLMYGPIEGGLLCIVGIFIASSFAYFIGKSLSEVTLDKIVGHGSREKMVSYLENYGFWTIFIFRISPFLSNDAVSFVSGLVKMNYWRFILATLAGITPLAALIAYFGRSTQGIETGLMVVSAVGLVALVIYIFVDRKRAHMKAK